MSLGGTATTFSDHRNNTMQSKARTESIRYTILLLSLLGILAGILIHNGDLLNGALICV